MSLPEFKDIHTLDQLSGFLEKAAQNGSLETRWFGRKILVDNQKVSVDKIKEKFEQVAPKTEQTQETVQTIGKVLHNFLAITQKEKNIPRYIKFFRFFTGHFKKNFTSCALQTIPDTNPEKGKFKLFLMFSKTFGDQYPKTRESIELCTITEQSPTELADPSLTNVMRAIFSEVPLNETLSVLKFLEKNTNHTASKLSSTALSVLETDLAAILAKEFTSDQQIWEKLFNHVKDSKNHPAPSSEELQKILTEANKQKTYKIIETLKKLDLQVQNELLVNYDAMNTFGKNLETFFEGK